MTPPVVPGLHRGRAVVSVLLAVVVVVMMMRGFGCPAALLASSACLSVARRRAGDWAGGDAVLGLGLAPGGCDVLRTPDEGGVAQGSPGTDVALSRPGSLARFTGGLQRGGTVVVLVGVRTPPDP